VKDIKESWRGWRGLHNHLIKCPKCGEEGVLRRVGIADWCIHHFNPNFCNFNVIESFAKECLELNGKSVILKSEVYRAFWEYCGKIKIPVFGPRQFSKRLPKFIEISGTFTRRRGKGARAWKGIKLKLSS